MKLNKNGWGVSEMAALLGILLFFFLLVIVLVVNFYKSVYGNDDVDTNINNSNNDIQLVSSYEEFEIQMENAADSYISNKYGLESNIDSIVIDGNTLLNLGYYSNVGYEDCVGYVNSSVSDGLINSNAFIKCNKYMTEGYGD